MKKWILVVGVVCATGLVEAASKRTPMNKEQYIASRKALFAKKGWSFSPAKAAKQFVQIDVNKDGIASSEEQKAYWSKK